MHSYGLYRIALTRNEHYVIIFQLCVMRLGSNRPNKWYTKHGTCRNVNNKALNVIENVAQNPLNML